jgi:hypothetical protein
LWAKLPAERHFVLGDACRDFRIAEVVQLLLVERREVVEKIALHAAVDAGGIREIQHGVATAAEFHALEARRQKAGSPVEVVEDLTAACAFAHGSHDHVSRQVFRFRSQAVAEPCPQRRPSGKLSAAQQKRNGRGVIHGVRVHRFDEAQFVRNGGRVGHEIADPCA